MQDVIEGEAKGMNRRKSVEALEKRLAGIDAGVERERQTSLLNGAIDLHVGIVMHRQRADGRYEKAGDAFAMAEGLHVP